MFFVNVVCNHDNLYDVTTYIVVSECCQCRRRSSANGRHHSTGNHVIGWAHLSAAGGA